MEILNATEFRFGAIPSRLNFPGHSLTLIVKGTFDLLPDGTLSVAKDQAFPVGDVPYEDDEEGAQAPRYPSDFAPTKLNTDIGFAGRCIPPAGKPVQRCEARIRVGDFERAIVIVGDRRWQKSLFGGKASDPEPFSEMELRYGRSLGGQKYQPNPDGVGHRMREGDPVPNLGWTEEHANNPPPAGFGPIHPKWDFRKKKLGSYKRKKEYLKTRWPWFAADFDPTYFNSAPPSMQMSGYLKGDEVLRLENLHPELARLETRLPGQRVRCFVERDVNPTSSPEFLEVDLVLDSLFVDGDASQLLLVWRGNTQVHDEDFEEIQRAFVMSEPLAQPPASLEACRTAMITFTVGDAADTEEPPEPPESEPETAEPEPSPPVPDPELERLEKAVEDAKARFGMDPDGMPELSGEERTQMGRLLAVMGMADEDIRAAGVSENDLALDSPEEKQKIWELRQELNPDELDPGAEPLPEEPPAAEPLPHTRSSVIAALVRGESLDGQDLSGLDLSCVDLHGVTMEGVDLSSANLVAADLTEAVLLDVKLDAADLSRAKLAGASMPGAKAARARFEKASLIGADLTGAELKGAVFAGSSLEFAVFQGADLAGTVFDEANGNAADFTEADLTGASFRSASMDGALFTQCRLDRVVFHAASMVEATLHGAKGEGVVLAEADLTGLRASGKATLPGADLRRVSGDGAKFGTTVLDGADLSGSTWRSADFTKASLVETDFTGSVMKSAKFRRANLTRAKLVDVDLFEGILERANLTDADLGGSNFYSAEFLEAETQGIRTEGTNLKMTKLA